MGNYLKLFENHNQYEDFVSGNTFVRPNVSHCITENHVHYNDTLFLYTPKQIMEFIHSFQNQFYNRYGDIFNVSNSKKQEISSSLQQVYQDTGIRITNYQNVILSLGIFSDDEYVTQQYNDKLIGINFTPTFTVAVSFHISSEEFWADLNNEPPFETWDEWNNYYVIKDGYRVEQTDGDRYLTQEEEAYIKNHICLLIPKSVECLNETQERSQVTIGYIDDNENYSLTQPQGFMFDDFTMSLFSFNSVSVTMALYNQNIQDVDDAVFDARECVLSLIKGDFSAFSSIDSYKVPLTKKQKNFIDNPMSYLPQA